MTDFHQNLTGRSNYQPDPTDSQTPESRDTPSELEQLLIIAVGQLMMHSDEYPNVGQIVAAVLPHATANALAAQKALLDKLQVSTWKDDNTKMNITRHDFWQYIEAERQQLGKDNTDG